MFNNKLKISTKILIIIAITVVSGCSRLSGIGGGSVAKVDEKLIIPPSLQKPGASTAPKRAKSVAARKAAPVARSARPKKAVYQPDGNYYIIVGTYPDQLDALDTFTRLSSIGLKGATMETRRTKAGSLLHMVRLGPYKKQEDIDEAKDSLTNTGLSQFKIVKN